VPVPDTNSDVSALAAPGLEEWHLDLHAGGARREEAVERLQGLLLRASRRLRAYVEAAGFPEVNE
jgi:hypothetical protein